MTLAEALAIQDIIGRAMYPNKAEKSALKEAREVISRGAMEAVTAHWHQRGI